MKTTFVMQHQVINNLSEKFEREVNNLTDYGIPGTRNQQSKYHSRAGKLLYLVKFFRPNLANVVKELSKHMDVVHLVAYKEIFRVLQFMFLIHVDELQLFR
jgi:hypothetical protein